jgi:predicted transcriptional regulator
MTESDMLQMIVDEINAIEILDENDITVARVAEKTGRKPAMVFKYLNEKVQAGQMVIVKKYDPQCCRNVNVYQFKIQ